MNAVDTIDVLNRLVVIHNRSLVSYLSYASPTWHRGDQEAQETLSLIVADQEQTVDKLGEMIVDMDGAVSYGAYPMAFTGYHDLSFDFLLDKLLERQRRDISEIETCVALLEAHPVAQAAAQEALGAAKAHLQSLEELNQSASTA